MLPALRLNPRGERHLNIAFFVEGMSASGVDTSTQLVAQSLRKSGHHVTLFVPWTEKVTNGTAFDLFRLPAMRFHSKQTLYYLGYPISVRVLAKFHREHFDVIHVHTSSMVNILAWQVSKLFDLPMIYTYHTMSAEYTHYWGPLAETMAPLMGSATKIFDRMVCNLADIIVTPSQKAADYLSGIEVSPQVKVIPNGIDTDRFCPRWSGYLRARFNIPEHQKILLFVGRINQEKKPLVAYQAFRDLCRLRNDVCLVMVGEGPLQEELNKMAVRDHLADRVHFAGLIDYAKMPEVYNSADIWISTSTSEVHPMVALEATACGLPAVVMEDKALEGVIRHGANGYIADSVPKFVDYLDGLLRDQQQYASMSQTTVSMVRIYDVEITAQRLHEVYESLLCKN